LNYSLAAEFNKEKMMFLDGLFPQKRPAVLCHLYADIRSHHHMIKNVTFVVGNSLGKFGPPPPAHCHFTLFCNISDWHHHNSSGGCN